MYRIRFHGRGGQGMKTASRVLGSAFFHEGFEVQDAPRYGAERRGAPMNAYVRADRAPIYERGIILRPDLVIVADDTLVPIPAAGVLQGLDNRSVLLIDSATPEDEWRKRTNIGGPILVLPLPDTVDRSSLPMIGIACAGAAARLIGVISEDALEQAVRDELAPLGEAVVEKNIQAAMAGYAAMSDHAGTVSEGVPAAASGAGSPDWVDVPVEEVRLSGPAIHAGATSVEVRTGLWRTFRPVIHYDRCNHCNWVCSSFCPDNAISVAEDGRPVIDYDHCKGCMICVVQCPPHAIESVLEVEAAAAERRGSA